MWRNRVRQSAGDGTAQNWDLRRSLRRQRGGIVDGRNAASDRFSEGALTLEQRRHRGSGGAANGLPLPLIVDGLNV